MNHRERVVAALNHKETGRVPIDLGSTIVTTATRIAYQNLLEHLGLPPDPEPAISHRQMDTVYPREDLLARWGGHGRPLLELARGKPIALGEVGVAPTVEKLEDQPAWTWFMRWGDPGGRGSRETRELFSSDRVITYGELPWVEIPDPVLHHPVLK